MDLYVYCTCSISLRDLRATYAIGVKVSKPFAADQGKPFFFTLSWRFRAVMSTAKAWRQEFIQDRRSGKDGGGAVSLLTYNFLLELYKGSGE